MEQADTSGEPDWLAIRRAYEDQTETLSSICEKFSVSRGKIYRRAMREKWPMRLEPLTVRGRAMALVPRLFKAVERQMREIEGRMGGDGDRGAAERESDARTLATLVRTLERLATLDRRTAPRPAAPGGRGDGKPGGKRGPDVIGLRQALARRIARLAGLGDG